MIQQNTAIKLFENCIPVKGYCRSIIYDLQRSNYDFVPNDVVEFINQYDKTEISKILETDDSFFTEKQEYLDYLLQKEYLFKCEANQIGLFPQMDLAWKSSSLITNAVLGYDKDLFQLDKTLEELEYLGCRHILVVSEKVLSEDEIQDFLNQLIKFSFLSVQIITKYSDKICQSKLEKICSQYHNIQNIVFFDSNLEETKNVKSNILFFFQDNFPFIPVIDLSYFVVGVYSFTEAQKHNIYFNRKVFIDFNGDIKNSLNANKVFGNIRTNSIINSINNEDFQDIWYNAKDNTDICKSCEFRYMCIDGRVPTQRKDNNWYHTTECNYNPYIAKWAGEEDYLSLAECGIISNEEGFSIDEEKVNLIVQELYGDE